MPKRKIAPTLGPNKRKNVAISKAVKNEIREMIKAGLNKSQVEAQLQKEKKIEGGINITQWKRLSASRNQPQEIIATQQYRTKKNPSTEEFKAECVNFCSLISLKIDESTAEPTSSQREVKINKQTDIRSFLKRK
mgnify:CR=1 FL=1